MKTTKIQLMLWICLALMASPALQAQTETPDQVNAFFDELDANGDGEIQRSEVPTGNHENFDETDVNGDKIVTREEFEEAMGGESVTDIKGTMTEYYYAIGNADSDTVIVNTQGGPMPILDTDEFAEMFSEVDLENALVVNVHQDQTLHQDKINKKVISFEEAKTIDAESVRILAEVVDGFLRQKKRVYVVGISFGAWMVQDLLATQGSVADGYLIQVGRLDMPEEIWKSFAAGGGGYFEDGVTPVVESLDDVDETKLSSRKFVEQNLPKIAAGLGNKRYTKLLVDVDLSKVTYMYGERDEAVGRLSESELEFLKNKNVSIFAAPGGHGDRQMDEKMYEILNQFISSTENTDDEEGGDAELDEFFDDLDRNGNGKIERSEVPEENQGNFDSADANGDKVVTRDELRLAFGGGAEEEDERDHSNREQESGSDKQADIPAHNKTVSPDSKKESLWTHAEGEDWPSFLGANRDGKSNETGILKDWSGNNLEIAWQRKLGSGYSNVSVSRGRAIVVDRIGDELRLICMKAETGEHLWEYRTGNTYVDDLGYSNGPRAAPVIDQDRVYIHGPSGHLICIDFLTGDEVWHVDTFKQFDVAKNFFGVASTPIIEGDVLLVMVGGSTKESQKLYDRSSSDYSLLKPNGSCVVAFNKQTGSVIYETGNYLCSWSTIQTATINGRRWGFAYSRHGLMGFNPADGSEDFYVDWQPRQWKKTNIATPIVVDNTVLISESYGPGSLYLNISNDEPKQNVIWQDGNRVREKKIQTCVSTAIHLDGYLYGCSSDGPSSGDFRCIELATGELKWKERVLVGLGNATYVDGHFIVTAEHGKLMLIKATPEKFEMVTEYKTPSDEFPNRVRFSKPLWAAPVVSHGLLYIRDADNLYCFRLK